MLSKGLPPRGVHQKQRIIIEFLTAEVLSVDIHRDLKNDYGNSTIVVSTISCWAKRSKSKETDINDKPQSDRAATAVTPENKSRIDTIIKVHFSLWS